MKWFFYGVKPQEKNRTTDSDMWLKKTWLSLSSSSNTGNITCGCLCLAHPILVTLPVIFQLEMVLKGSDNVSRRKAKNFRLALHLFKCFE